MAVEDGEKGQVSKSVLRGSRHSRLNPASRRRPEAWTQRQREGTGYGQGQH
jgi:hypothetical protein